MIKIGRNGPRGLDLFFIVLFGALFVVSSIIAVVAISVLVGTLIGF